MLNPYYVTALLYASVAAVVALDASLTSFGLTPFLSGLRWLRVHFITLGIMAEAIFGFLAAWATVRTGERPGKTRWDIWFAFNVGLIVLLIGIPLVNTTLILVGGTLVFTAASLLVAQLWSNRATARDAAPGRKFYVAGLAFLLIGIILGTGLWLGWGAVLRVVTPLEAHIHANNWGFMGLVFAGLVVDHYPSFAGRPLAWPRSITALFWMLTVGAALLVIGPWVGSNAFVMPGIAIYLVGTGLLLANMIKPILGERRAWTAGMWHLLTSYIWITLPVIVAPFLILDLLGVPAQIVEGSAPQALIYGWVLQVGFAFVPYMVRRTLDPARQSALGGSWLSLGAVSAGGVFLWLSIFVPGADMVLHALAYACWFISIVPFVVELWRVVQSHTERATIPATL